MGRQQAAVAMGRGQQSATDPRYDVNRPPAHPELAASRQTLGGVAAAAYWRSLCPDLHLCDAAFVESCSQPFAPPTQRLQDLRSQIDGAGVAQVDAQELPWSVDLGVLADAVVTLVRHGWPPSALIMYDEVWCMVQQASRVMAQATGGNTVNLDILAWLVDPNRGDAGFSPHRDRQPDDSPSTFRPDGSPMYATCWVPLTHATPENSCLYVIPRWADPGYYEGDPEEEGAPDPLAAALSSKEAYAAVRALPATPGSALLFTHRTIHWGSKGRVGYPTPRISLSWGCAGDDYEAPYFSREHLPCPPLELRLALLGAQLICYHERFPAPPKQLKLYYEAFTAHADKFDSNYQRKVRREFVDASKEATAAAAAAGAGAAAGSGPAAAADNGAGSSKQAKQGNASGRSSKKRGKAKPAPAEEEAPPQAAASSKGSKRHKAAAAAAAAAAAPPAGEEESEDDREGIDFAALAAQAKARKAAAAAGGKGSSSQGAAAAAGDSDEEDDVLDLALEAMLDAGADDFADDYEDE